MRFIFFFNDTATTEIYTLSLHDALPIFVAAGQTILLGELIATERTPKPEPQNLNEDGTSQLTPSGSCYVSAEYVNRTRPEL